MRIIILGPPGSGKGTQARRIAEHFSLKHVSTGEIFRNEYKKKSNLGVRAHSFWGNGNLVPDEITIPLANNVIPRDDYILDGYPRTIPQAESLKKVRGSHVVINLVCSREELIKRVLKRAKIERRVDDTKEAIETRLEVYKIETKPLIAFYEKEIINFDGNPKEEIITKKILNKLKKFNL